MGEVIGRGVIEVSADASKMNAAIGEARKSIASLGDASKNASASSAKSIDRYVQSLQTQNATLGKSKRETELYKLALRGASDEQLNAANSALRLAEASKQGDEAGKKIRTGLIAIGTAAAVGLIAAAVAFDQLVKKAGDFQDLAEKTGDSAENIASLAVAAGTAGTSMDQVSSISQKLSKGLAGVDDDSKSTGAAITALGLNLSDFKKLKPADQLEAVGKAMNGFEDSASKTAIAMALFGKSGAESLPFLKALGEEGGRQVILTNEQIALADQYADAQGKLRAEISLHAQAIATQALPAYNDLEGAFLDLIKDVAGIKDGVKGLGNSKEIQDFADNAVKSLAFLVDAADGVVRVFQIIGTTIAGVLAAAYTANTGDIRGAAAIIKDIGSEIDDILQRATLGGKLAARIAARSNQPQIAAEVAKKPDLNFTGAIGKDKSAEEAKARLATELAKIKSAADEEVAIYANSEKILEANRAAGLLSEQKYYEGKLAFLNLNSMAQQDALKQELDRLNKVTAVGKDKEENDKKIIETQAKLSKLYIDTAGSLELLAIKTDELNKKGDWFEGANKASKEFLINAENVAAHSAAMFTNAFDGMLNGISSSFSRAIVYGEDLEQSLANVALGIADSFIAAFIKIQIQKLFIDKAAAAAGATGIIAQAHAVSLIAAQNAYASTMLIPGGPALAPAAAAAAFAGAEGWALGIEAAALAAAAARALGGPVSSGGLYRVNEKGPELLSVGGKDFLMMGSQSGNITANNKMGGANGVSVHISDNTKVYVDSRSDRLQVIGDMQKMIEVGHARLIEKLQRQGHLV